MTLHVLVDMNLSPTWVQALSSAGIPTRHWSSIGASDAVDATIFSWARENGYVVFTHDLDFGSMLALTQAEAPSVFQIRTDDVSPHSLAARAIALLRRFESELRDGALIVADEHRDRIRLLPLVRPD